VEYYIHLAIMIGIYMIFAQSFNLCFGLGRLFNLAHVASYAVGAYTAALLSTELSGSFLFCILASVCVSGLFAFLVGLISLKLTQDYFAIGTLAFSSIVTALLINWKSLTRGVLGIPGIPRPELGAIDFNENSNFLILTFVLVLFIEVLLYLIFRSRFARNLRCQAEYEYAALALAQNTVWVRNISFFLSSAIAGLAGALFAYYINYIDPSSFMLTEMVFVLTIVVVGKPGSFWGCLVGTIFLVLLPEPLRFIEISPSILGPMRQLMYAVILFGMVYVNRRRLFPVQREV
jgi:branched-chain amino acid transport system permease protein